MQTPASQPPFPLGKTLKVMTCVAAAMFLLELLIVPGLFGSPAGAVPAVLLMGSMAWLSGMLSVLPVVREQGNGPLAVVKVFFIGMCVRVLVAVVAIIVAIKVLQLPTGPVAVATILMYLPLLFVETRMMAAYVKTLDSAGPKGTAGQAHQAETAAKPHADRNDDQSTAPCTEALA